jgi:hypothetical protein
MVAKCVDIYSSISDLLEDITEFIPIFRLWANSETKLADPLTAMADSLDTNSSALKKLVQNIVYLNEVPQTPSHHKLTHKFHRGRV